MKVTGEDLRTAVRIPTPVFGVAYSILTIGGITKTKPADNRIETIRKILSKSIENGHATAFLLTKDGFTKTGAGDEKWVFNEGGLDHVFARHTENANTDVYYTDRPSEDYLINKFKDVRDTLTKQNVAYGLLRPNMPLWTPTQNCVSSTHRIVYEMGLGYWGGQGWWVPSLANHFTWLACNFTEWKHIRLPECNTLPKPERNTREEVNAGASEPIPHRVLRPRNYQREPGRGSS